MAKKKSIAQIKRMQSRAEARGEEYVPPEQNADDDKSSSQNEKGTNEDDFDGKHDNASDDPKSAKLQVDGKHDDASDDPKSTKLQDAAIKLQKELKRIEGDENIKSKERRSAKKKAEAIGTEESGMSTSELLEWFEKHAKESKTHKKHDGEDGKARSSKEKKIQNPYIAFIGQLSYDTTPDNLFEHIRKELGDDFKITKEAVVIRILTDAKTKKSRGMAFVEVENADILYALLKLHQTFLDGRRINVERSSGGSKNSEGKKTKIAQFRKEQDQYFAEVVNKMLEEYKSTGELREGELDAGVISLCNRHSATIVQAALAKYIEGGGRDMDNPSAYLSFLIGKFAEEGIFEPRDGKSCGRDGKSSGRERPPKRSYAAPPAEKQAKRLKTPTSFSAAGVDMSISKPQAKDLSTIFPSLARRGRGRGYM
jgi:RNA recognition motif-containing protein